MIQVDVLTELQKAKQLLCTDVSGQEIVPPLDIWHMYTDDASGVLYLTTVQMPA